jgi:small-conductance mechanosensitive channel
MSTSKVVNESGIHPKLRVRLDIDVAYDSDLDHVEKVLLDIAKKADYVEKEPSPRVRFREFRDFSIRLQFLFWVKKPVYKGRFKSFIIKDIHKRFKKEGIEFPYPTQEIFIKNKKIN